MTFEQFLESKTFGDLVTGLTSSAIFLFLLYLMKPNLRISDCLACSYNDEEDQDKRRYYFKVINRSLLFKIYDIKVRVYSCENIPSHNGDDIILRDIELKKNNQWVMARMNYRHLCQDFFIGEKRLSTRSDYAAQFSTHSNLKNLLNHKNFIRVEVLAKHSLTGFSVVKTKTYKHSSNIKDGHFISGNSCKILK